MRTLKLFLLVLVLLPTLAFAQKKAKKPTVPAVFDHARFVYVQAIDGDEFKPGLNTDDRLAIADVRDALSAWGRYTYTTERDQADLIFVVRKGRLASAHAGAGLGGDPDAQDSPFPSQQRGQRTPGTVVNTGAETGPEDDLLEVCQVNTKGKLTNPLWIHTFRNGLDAPKLLLFAQLKDEVERAYPKAPAPPPAKP